MNWWMILVLLSSLNISQADSTEDDGITVESELSPQRTGCSAAALKEKTLGNNAEENDAIPANENDDDTASSSKRPKSAARKEAEAYLAQEKQKNAITQLLEQIPQEKGVLVLNETNFETAVSTFPDILVEFYAPWCGHCKKLAPLYAQTATRLREMEIGVFLAKVDATADKELSDKHGVKAFPTIKYFHDGEFVTNYAGEHSSDAMDEFAKRAVNPVSILNTVEEQKAVHNIPGWRAIGSFPTGNSAAFEKAARMVDGVFFGMAGPDALRDIDQAEDLVAMVNGRKSAILYTGDLYNSSQLAEFFRETSIDLVSEIKDSNARTLMSGKIRKFFFFTGDPDDMIYKKIKRAAKKIAPEFNTTLRFIFSESPKNKTHVFLTSKLGIKTDREKTAVRVFQTGASDMDDWMRFQLIVDNATTSDSVRNFVLDVLAGKIPEYKKSQKLPKNWDKKPVKVLTRANFEKITKDSGKNVLVEFYSPYCGACQALEPIYNYLAEQFQMDDGIIIAKMDVTENDIDGIKITSFPTIYLYRREDEAPILYESQQTFKRLSEFVKNRGENAGNKNETGGRKRSEL